MIERQLSDGAGQDPVRRCFRCRAKCIVADSLGVTEARLSLAQKSLLGAGCFGVVFKVRVVKVERQEDNAALMLRPGQCLAMKVVPVSSRPRRSKEFDILRNLSHPNVIKLCGYYISTYGRKTGQDSNTCLNLLIELMPCTLFDLLQEIGALTESTTFAYFSQLVMALSYIHSKGICHRDVKPSNLLVDSKRQVLKICDFGSAVDVRSTRLRSIPGEATTYVCSRFYRAPELLLCARSYDCAIDVWSAGCVLAEMLTGRVLFAGQSAMDQLVEIVHALGTPSEQDLAHMDVDVLSMPKVWSLERETWQRQLSAASMADWTARALDACLCYSPRQRVTAAELQQRLAAQNQAQVLQE